MTERPKRQSLWTPVPKTYDPETYAAWGRKHYGDDWCEQRRIMLKARNIYDGDQVYADRQRAPRAMEHKIEKRPFRPIEGLLIEGWQQLWARLSNVLPSVEHGSNPTSLLRDNSDSNSNDGSEQSIVTGFITYPPTPKPRNETPRSKDPWERLEYNRRRQKWDEETYQSHRIFLKKRLIDEVRTEREDEGGDRRAREEWEAILDLKWTDNWEYERQKRD